MADWITTSCPPRDGTGKVDTENGCCQRCGGRGYVAIRRDTHDAYVLGVGDGLGNRRLRSPDEQPQRAAYRTGYVAGQRQRRAEAGR